MQFQKWHIKNATNFLLKLHNWADSCRFLSREQRAQYGKGKNSTTVPAHCHREWTKWQEYTPKAVRDRVHANHANVLRCSLHWCLPDVPYNSSSFLAPDLTLASAVKWDPWVTVPCPVLLLYTQLLPLCPATPQWPSLQKAMNSVMFNVFTH